MKATFNNFQFYSLTSANKNSSNGANRIDLIAEAVRKIQKEKN